MCGICGLLDYSNKKIEENTIQQMCSKMEHRGPDGQGVYVSNQDNLSIGLGHRRLKIIDLSQAGHQPMFNEDGSIVLVFNGEIYNYQELRPVLEAKGHVFKSHTDTECLIHLYEEYGQDCVKQLRGMFAFAIWDRKKEILMLARDRVGKKPLLYYYKNGNFCFASEFCALLASGFISKEINRESLSYYLELGYIPAPLTIYKDVFKLPPAHFLILTGNQISIHKYWQLDYTNKIKISEQEASNEMIKLLKEAVNIRLYSDVALGAFLSGGIDSSAVVALMSQLSLGKVKTFSIGFDEKDYSELKYARNIAKRYNTEHNEFIVRPKALEVLPLLVENYGEPYADSSCIPTYYVSKETKKFVTVALNGDGGDESFAGYDRYNAMLVAEKVPVFARKIISDLSYFIPDSVNFRNKFRRIKRFLKALDLSTDARYLKWVSIFDQGLKKELCSDEFLRTINAGNALNLIKQYVVYSGNSFSVDTLLSTDVLTYLPYDLLVKVDIASMSNSLEARSPFLDHKLMEFAASLPANFKIRRGIKKYILKKAIKNLVPQENISRAKMGFGVPIGKWLRGELKDYLKGNLLSGKFVKRGYFNQSVITRLVNDHTDNKTDYSYQLWALLMLELWHQRFID